MPKPKPARQRRRTKSPPREPAGLVWTRRVAWLLALVTFPLLWVGGLVTTTKSGMAVPDWPNTYGYNMFLYPWRSWLFGPWDLFIEHGHRLLASFTGLLTIALMVLLLKFESRAWMRTVGVVALVGVLAQGLLGGLRVVLGDRMFAMVHGSTGPLFFALTVAMLVWLTRTWRDADRAGAPSSLGRLAPLAGTAVLLVYVQIVVGAMLRHMPVGASPQGFAGVVQAHLLLATLVLVFTVAVALNASRAGMPRIVRRWGWFAGAVVLLQLSLGMGTWLAKYGTPVWAQPFLPVRTLAIVADGWTQSHVITAHQAVGSLLLVSMLVTTMFAWRFAPVLATSETNFVEAKGAAPA